MVGAGPGSSAGLVGFVGFVGSVGSVGSDGTARCSRALGIFGPARGAGIRP